MTQHQTPDESVLPFIPEGCVVKDNVVQYYWTDLTEMVPEGSGVCMDAGAGDGRHRQAIENKGWRWIGLDMFGDSRLSVIGSICKLPFSSESIDLVFTCQVLEHITHPFEALSELFRVLRPSGLLIGSASFLEPWHGSYYGFSHWGLEQILSDCGFQLVEVRPGASVFVVLTANLFPNTNLGSTVGGAIGRFTIWFLKWFGGGYILLRFGKNSNKWKQYKSFLEKAPLRFAGHIRFVAQKREKGDCTDQ